MALECSTLRQTVAKLITDYDIRDYLRQFYLIHENASSEADESSSEAAFVRHMMEDSEPNQIELEKLFKRTNPIIRETVRLLALIAPLPVAGKPVLSGPTELKAFHESLFRALYQIRVNLRGMFELAFDCEEDPDELIGYLIDKYDLVSAELEAFSTDWMDTYETICQGLLDQSLKLTIFTDDHALFRLVDEDGCPAIGVPPYLKTANELIVSKDYFFLQILTVLKHVEVMTKISSLEKEQPYDSEEIPVIEMFEMDNVFSVAEAFMDKE